jgi:hypothetical protein
MKPNHGTVTIIFGVDEIPVLMKPNHGTVTIIFGVDEMPVLNGYKS